MLILKVSDNGVASIEQGAGVDPDFSLGYRHGFPLVGEALPPVPSNPSAEYLRGLQAGQKDYVPGVLYEPDEDEE